MKTLVLEQPKQLRFTEAAPSGQPGAGEALVEMLCIGAHAVRVAPDALPTAFPDLLITRQRRGQGHG